MIKLLTIGNNKFMFTFYFFGLVLVFCILIHLNYVVLRGRFVIIIKLYSFSVQFKIELLAFIQHAPTEIERKLLRFKREWFDLLYWYWILNWYGGVCYCLALKYLNTWVMTRMIFFFLLAKCSNEFGLLRWLVMWFLCKMFLNVDRTKWKFYINV